MEDHRIAKHQLVEYGDSQQLHRVVWVNSTGGFATIIPVRKSDLHYIGIGNTVNVPTHLLRPVEDREEGV